MAQSGVYLLLLTLLVLLSLTSCLITNAFPNSLRTGRWLRATSGIGGTEEDDDNSWLWDEAEGPLEWASSAEDDARLMEAAQSLVVPTPSLDAVEFEEEWGGSSDRYSDHGSSRNDEEAESLVALIMADPEAAFIESEGPNFPSELEGAQVMFAERVDGSSLTVEEAAESLLLFIEEEEEEEEEEEPLQFMTALDFMVAAESLEMTVLSDRLLGVADSHELVEVDEAGEPYYEKFVYVNEPACIGCTNCASIAGATFTMEGEHGRARAFQQQGDAEEIVEEAIDVSDGGWGGGGGASYLNSISLHVALSSSTRERGTIHTPAN